MLLTLNKEAVQIGRPPGVRGPLTTDRLSAGPDGQRDWARFNQEAGNSWDAIRVGKAGDSLLPAPLTLLVRRHVGNEKDLRDTPNKADQFFLCRRMEYMIRIRGLHFWHSQPLIESCQPYIASPVFDK